MRNMGLWQVFAGLGVPGLALGVMYMLFRRFRWEFAKVQAKWVGPIVVLFLALVGGITFYALSLFSPARDHGPADPPRDARYEPLNADDRALGEAIVGTWRSTNRANLPPGVAIDDLRYTIYPDHTFTMIGVGRFTSFAFPINLSGTWYIRDRMYYYEIRSSNVPLAYKEGFTAANKIVRVTDDAFVTIDGISGNQVSDPRVKP